MSKISQTSAIKTKVIFGFGLVFLAFIAASYFAYISFDKLLNSVEVIAQPDKKLVQIDSILVTVTKTENTLQEYTVTKSNDKLSSDKLKRFYDQKAQIDQQIQQLKRDVDYNKEEKLDSVLALLNVKLVSFEDFKKIKEQRDNFDFYNKALRELEVQIQSKKKIQEDSAQAQETPEEIEERRGIIGRIFQPKNNVSEALKKSLPIQPDSIFRLNADSVKMILGGVRREQAVIQRRLDQQELEYLTNNAQVMDNIYQLVGQIKEQQQANSEERTDAAKYTLEQSLSRIGMILAAVLLITAIIIYLIFADITKSDYYKRKLQAAKLDAERLARVKEDFLANMSHEIRTPLTAILGFTKQLKATSLNHTQSEYLQAIDNSSEHLLSLVNDILDFSKIEAGELKFEKSAFDIFQVVQQVHTDLLPQAQKKGLDFHYHTRGDECRFLRGDAFRLKQVLYNLIYNAIKFTETGHVSVKCLLAAANQKQIKVQISVEDTGVGIPLGKMKEIFGAFSQTDASNTRKYGGTGLGLTISKKLIEAQGGRIEVNSEEGKGSVFTVLLVFEKSSEEAVHAQIQSQPQMTDSFDGYKVLVIDDDELNTRLVKIILDKWGVDATMVHTGKEGIELFQQASYDLILCDLQMPEMDGETVARRVKALASASARRIPFVAFTARILKEDWKHYQSAGMDDYLLKPFNEEEMYQLLHKYLKPSGQQYHHDTASEAFIEEIREELQEELFISLPVSISLKNLRKFTGDDDEMLAQYLESFLTTNANNLEQLVESLETQDLQKASFHAHKMVSGVQQLESHELAADLRKLELLSTVQSAWDTHTAQLIKQVIEQTRGLLKRVEEEVSRLIQKAS